MLIALWIVNVILALVFLAAGSMKLVRPKPALVAAGMAYVDDFSAPSVKAIGAAELLGAVGLVLPLATGIAPILTPLAATGLTVLMIGATATHIRRKESPLVSAVLGAGAAVSAVLGFLVVLG